MTATCAIIPASGLGERLSNGKGKTFVPIAGQPLIAHTLDVFQYSPDIYDIVIVAREADIPQMRQLVDQCGFSKVSAIVPGGSVRQDSVRNGLAAVPDNCDIVVIHDGARPFVTNEIISASIKAAAAYAAAVTAIPVIDTIAVSTDGGQHIDSTPNRSELYAVQTPQTFQTNLINTAYRRAYEEGFTGTDDASLVRRLGVPVAIVSGSHDNLKITVPRDLILAEAILQERANTQQVENNMTLTSVRVGHGYDIHRFAAGRKLVLGGVEFPGEEGLLGHSDADVLLHAVADAVLGAAAANDIGHLFPDTDPAYKDARSTELLAKVGEVVSGRGWKVGNIDVTLIAQRPKIAKFTPQMRANIAAALGMSPDSVNVKATTAEGLGDIGQGLGIECHAVALLIRG